MQSVKTNVFLICSTNSYNRFFFHFPVLELHITNILVGHQVCNITIVPVHENNATIQTTGTSTQCIGMMGVVVVPFNSLRFEALGDTATFWVGVSLAYDFFLPSLISLNKYPADNTVFHVHKLPISIYIPSSRKFPFQIRNLLLKFTWITWSEGKIQSRLQSLGVSLIEFYSSELQIYKCSIFWTQFTNKTRYLYFSDRKINFVLRVVPYCHLR